MGLRELDKAGVKVEFHWISKQTKTREGTQRNEKSTNLPTIAIQVGNEMNNQDDYRNMAALDKKVTVGMTNIQYDQASTTKYPSAERIPN